MALIVEDGTGLSNAESYASVSYATTYFASIGVSGWNDTSFATGTLWLRTIPTHLDTITVGSVTYRFTNQPFTQVNDISIAATLEATQSNLVNAINGTEWLSGGYDARTAPNPYATIGTFDSYGKAILTAAEAGESGNSVATTASFNDSGVNRFNKETLDGGTPDREAALRKATRYLDNTYYNRWQGEKKSQTQALCWPRSEVYDRDDLEISSTTIPAAIMNVTCELAKIFLTEDLTAALSQDDTAGVDSESVTVGPISISQTFQGGRSQKSYPVVSMLVAPYISGSLERS